MTRALTACWTFLTRARSLRGGGGSAAAPGRRRRRRQRGVAIITVLIAISLTLILTNQFSTSTSVDLIASANYRDQMRAHFLARSAVNLGELVIRLQQKIDGAPKEIKDQIGNIQITEFANQLLLAFCGNAQEVRAAVGDAASLSKGLGADVGTCGVVGTISTDDDKINVNCANEPRFAAVTKSALDALVFFNAYDPVFEEADAENWRRDRALQVTAILDYIDRDSSRGVADTKSAGTTEDYGYESLKDHYRPKGTYLDTIGELKLVRGVDDRFWTLFGSALTVYGGCKLNLSAVTNVQLIAAILYLSVPEASRTTEPMLQDPQKLFALAGMIAKAKQFGVQFATTDEFIEFAKDPCAAIGALAGQTSLAGSQATAAVSTGIPGCTGGQKLGMTLDKKLIDTLAKTGPKLTYRMEAWGEVDRRSTDFPPIRSTITGVWDVRVQIQNARKAATSSGTTPKGAWVFLRED
jgi:general secretion pathway protein K